MAIKYDMQGLLIYAAMAAYLLAFIALCAGGLRPSLKDLGQKRTDKKGMALFALGSALSGAAFAYRWIHVQHAPMQNLFEVFLCLGAAVGPLSLFCRRVLGAASPASDALLGCIVLFPAGLVFKSEPQLLPPALQSPLFVPHVAAYMLAYVILVKAAVQAGMQLAAADPEQARRREQATYRLVQFGFPLLTLGLVLGSWWGKLAWGDYWNWDPKELWSLATWLIYLGYLHFRNVPGRRFPRAHAALAIAGAVGIIITLLWVNLATGIFPGLHMYGT